VPKAHLWIPIASLAVLGAPNPAAAQDPGHSVQAENGRVRVEARVEGGRLTERYLAQGDAGWTAVAEACPGGTAGPVAVMGEDAEIVAARTTDLRSLGSGLTERISAGGYTVERTVTLDADGPWVQVSTRLSAPGTTRLRAFVDRFRFLRTPDWSFAPSVGGFVPDAQYKAPLVLVQSGAEAFGIVPDLDRLDRSTLKRCNHALDLDVPGGPLLSVGFRPARYAYHSVYAADPGRVWTAESPVANSYFLLVCARESPAEAFRQAVRFHWARFGRPAQAHAAAEQKGTDARYLHLDLWDSWRKEIWERQSRAEWLTVGLSSHALGGGVATRRWGPGPSVYLTSWFNTLRTSTGMALYGRRTGDDGLVGLARQTAVLALEAPGQGGAFKCIAVPRGPGEAPLWAAGDGRGDSTERGYLGYDMSWTAYWLLRWKEWGLPGGEGILVRCRALADFLASRQEGDGMLPTRLREDGSVDETLSRTVKAETGPVALFLLELYRLDRNPRWLEAGLRGLRFLEHDVIPARQWYDYETFWSCSPREPALDRRTQQWPANDLALGQAVAAFLAAFQDTRDAGYLRQGERLLDYLLLYQQCWTNPALEDLTGPTMLLGGFTTQNSDAEWSDARQSQVGNILMDYYRATGTVEYLERGVAALRAQFPISPSENWAHIGYGHKAGVSSFHWGSGSGLAGIEFENDFLGDLVIDVAASTAVGVDGIDVRSCDIRGDAIDLVVSSPFAWPRPPVAVFHRGERGRSYAIRVNGTNLGTLSIDQLEKGVEIPAPRRPQGGPGAPL
jgi:hypothetical protein